MRLHKTAQDLLHTRRTIKNVHRTNEHSIVSATLDQLNNDIMEAQRLHARVYLRVGFVSDDDIENGVISKKSDPHQLHATYFAVKNLKTKEIVATARQIYADESKGINSFPLIDKAKLYPKSKSFLRKQRPSEIVEISGLAKSSGTPSSAILLLYRAMWHHSLKEEHEIWIMACDIRLFRRLKILFGPAIEKIGDQTSYRGGDIIPALLRPRLALESLLKISRRQSIMFGSSRRHLLQFFLEGVPSKLSKLVNE